MKLLITFYWFSTIQKNEEKNLLFAFEKDFLITYNFDFILDYEIYRNWLQSTRNQCWTFDDTKKP